MESEMKTLLGMVAAAVLLMNTSAHADPRFLKAAAFFLIGDLDLQYKVTTDNVETVEHPGLKAVVLQDESDPCIVHWINVGSQVSRTATVTLKSSTVNFNKMPSPRAFGTSFVSGIGGSMHSWVVNLPADAMCETTVQKNINKPMYPPTGKCFKRFSWFDTNVNGTGPHRLRALDYIRNNFCAGLPEPNGY
jgi:hypothetical protein